MFQQLRNSYIPIGKINQLTGRFDYFLNVEVINDFDELYQFSTKLISLVR